ncbi:hypothetical protein ACFFK0_03065 [Paenibacillus chartarius]|uniref:Rod shape-determining protein MreD n=1 Tax=Paenibacillus chartarius TaxID=747481 RepID=A0ABV6DFL7_9BACL
MILWERFDLNEGFVIIMLLLSYGAIAVLPKRLPASLLVLGLVWGFASSTLFDFTIGGGLMDFYVVNDSNQYELTDLLVYFMFAPFGYFFIYFYEVLHIRRKTLVWYILGWTAVGVGVQWIAEWMRMTTYQHGYRLEYNIAVFLLIQTITGLFYMYLKERPGNKGTQGGP